MAKITIADITSAFAGTAALNSRFDQVVDALNNKVLYRDNTSTPGEPNAMAQELDMGDFKIINLKDPTTNQDAVTKSYAEANYGGAASIAAEAAAELALNWATKIDGAVAGGEYSSKAYAIGGTGVTDTAGKGASKEWATKAEDSTVDGTEYSAKHYSAKSAASAAAASASETAAALSESNAATSETNAAASAVAAQNAADSLIWNDVVFKSFADSPITITETDRGVLYVIDSSGGSVEINLPEIATVTMPFSLGVKKSSADGNSVTLNRAATDTIDGLTTKAIQIQDAGMTLVADTDTAPDVWTALDFGPVSGNMTVDSFVDTVDYTSGTTTALTLSVAPGSENNVWVYFDGVVQHHSEYTLSGTTLTFSEAIPLGVDNVEVQIGTTLSIAVPADATVTYNKLASDISTILRGKNKIINGNFDIWQRGTSHSTAGYGSADRFRLAMSGTTQSMSRQSFALGQTDVPYNPKFFARFSVTSVAGSGNYALSVTRIEDVTSLSGKNVTLTFWAKADAAKDIAIDFVQDFGTGGAPSSSSSVAVETVSLTTSWVKQKVSVTLPSVSGKTLGTNGNDWLGVHFWFDAGSDFNARTNSLGQQSGTFDIAQVQIEEGSVATEFEDRSIGEELSLCQRYYWKTGADLSYRMYTNSAGNFPQVPILLTTSLRNTPSISTTTTLSGNIDNIGFAGASTTSFTLSLDPTAAGWVFWVGSISLDAEL